MSRVNLGTNGYLLPMPVALIGAKVQGKPNFMTAAWLSQVNPQPPLLAAALSSAHYTVQGITATGYFSVCIPGAELAAKVDYCGMESGAQHNKADLFEVFYSDAAHAPLIAQCPVCIECKLLQQVALPADYLYIGEILGTYIEDRCLTDGKPDIKKINPLLLSMPETKYWTVGDLVGKAWELGKEIKQ